MSRLQTKTAILKNISENEFLTSNLIALGSKYKTDNRQQKDGRMMLPTAACSLKMPHNFWTKLGIGSNSGMEEKWRNKQEMRKDTKKY